MPKCNSLLQLQLQVKAIKPYLSFQPSSIHHIFICCYLCISRVVSFFSEQHQFHASSSPLTGLTLNFYRCWTAPQLLHLHDFEFSGEGIKKPAPWFLSNTAWLKKKQLKKFLWLCDYKVYKYTSQNIKVCTSLLSKRTTRTYALFSLRHKWQKTLVAVVQELSNYFNYNLIYIYMYLNK